jgi:DNA-binding CsgD family transcriptional regulator
MEAGVGNQGWTIPLWGPSGELATFSVNHRATDDEWDAITRVKAKDFLLIAHLVHQQAMRIINKEMAEATRDLSRREREALSMLSNGMARAEVADRLGISENTLRAYIDSARHKLGAANVTHAVALAIANGMIAANEPLPKY